MSDATQHLANIRSALAEQRDQAATLSASIASNQAALSEAQAQEQDEIEAGAALRKRVSEMERQATTARAKMLAAKHTPEHPTTAHLYDAATQKLATARMALAAWEKAWTKRQPELMVRQRGLVELIDSDRATLAEIQALIAALGAEEADATQAVGEEQYAALAHEQNEQQETCDNIIAALEEAEAEQRQMARTAMEHLAAWPDLVQRFKDTYLPDAPTEDSTTRVLDAILAALDALERDGTFLSHEIDGRKVLEAIELPERLLHLMAQQPDTEGRVRRGTEVQDRRLLFANRRAFIQHLRANYRPRPWLPLASLV